MTRTTLTALSAAVFALGMLGLAFASKPLYDAFCRVTGFGGTPRIATAAPASVASRDLTVRFDANVNGLPIRFGPAQPKITVQPGVNALAFYTVTNTSGAPVIAHATYNVTPHKMGPYFSKLECFCFEDRVFAPGETVELPVVFFIDPAMADERSLDDVGTVTLSYTFFPAGETGGEVAEAPAPAAGRSP